jgi:hypothetical protein
MLPQPVAAGRIELQAMYSAVYLEKFALTETSGLAGLLACDWSILGSMIPNSK